MKVRLLTVLAAILLAGKSNAQTISITSTGGITICSHSVIDTFTATVSGSATYGFIWRINATGIVSSSPTYIPGVRALPTGVDTVYCFLTNAAGDTILAISDTILVTVDSLPAITAITGLDSVCMGDSVLFSEATTGGMWQSSNPASASVDAGTGVVYGVAPPAGGGAAVSIEYIMTNSCGSDSVRHRITVDAPAGGPITGPSSICSDTFGLFTEAAPGGTWTTSDTFTAEFLNIPLPIPGAALQTFTTGTVTVYYNVANACGVYEDSMIVNVINCDTTTTISYVVPVTSLEGAVNIFPNPNDGTFSVSLTGKYATANCTISNMLGENVKEVTLTGGGATEFNLNVPQGMYIVTVTSGSEKYITKVVVTQ